MSRQVLPETQLHPAIQQKVANLHADIIEEVRQAAADNDVLVIGMWLNPHVKRARKALEAKGQPYRYLEYGGYHSMWRRRNALKMWTGWPTFPMVFVKGSLIGGANEVERLLSSGEFAALLA